MNKCLSLVIVLLCSLYANAQNYTRYYRQTALAEECIRNGELKEALQHFDSAFVGYDFKFAKDCYIAAQTASYLGSQGKAYIYLLECIKSGIKPGCIKRNRLFVSLWTTKYGAMLDQKTDSLWNIYLKRINPSLSAEWTKRYKDEQKIKGQKGPYSLQVEANIAAIGKLLDKGVFPGERLIGVDNSIDIAKIGGIFPSDSCSYESCRVLPTLQHYQYSYEIFKSKLYKAMMAGYLHPYDYLTVFVFNKSKVCEITTTTSYAKELDLATSTDGKLCFQVMFESGETDSLTAIKNRYDWYIPRPGKYSISEVYRLYGINMSIGHWIDWRRPKRS